MCVHIYVILCSTLFILLSSSSVSGDHFSKNGEDISEGVMEPVTARKKLETFAFKPAT